MIPVTLFSLSGATRLLLAVALLLMLWLLTDWAVTLP